MSAPVLVLNSGSSSLKVGVFVQAGAGESAILEGSADGIGRGSGSLQMKTAAGETLVAREHISQSQGEALAAIAEAIGPHLPAPLAAVGHRVVHGGPKLREHQRITPEVMQQLEAAVHFAPLHIPVALEVIRGAQQLYPGVPQFACFDTAFHRTLPEVSAHLPLPERYWKAGVQRYGFHGLSCESILAQLPAPPPPRLVIAHLGNGASITAVRDGRSVDTSMGLTPAGGIPMGTRTGDLDPGVLLFLLRTEKLGADELEALVNRESGLKGLSDGESDMQALLARSDDAAKLAVEAFCIAARKTVGAYAALMGGLDLLVFTGGIGAHSHEIRQRVVDDLDWLGCTLDPAANKAGERCISSPTSRVMVLAMETDEERAMAKAVQHLLGGAHVA